MYAWITQFGTWLRSVYSEANGTGSSTRVHMSAVIFFVIGVGISFAVMVHHHTMTLEQYNLFLGAAGVFIATVCGVLYGINKASSAVELNTNKTQGQ